MRSRRQLRLRRAALGWVVPFLLFAWILLGVGTASAQLVSLKTAPIATGSQFQLYPSATRAMGGLTVVVDDSLGDTFVNPAKAARLETSWAFGAPTHYTITGQDGGARTLSVGTVLTHNRWFGGVGVALQQLDPGSRPSRRIFRAEPGFTTLSHWRPPSIRPLRETSAENQYVTVLGGAQLTDHVALAGKVQWAGLEAMEGVDLLYPGNRGLRQDGHRLDVRVGLLREREGQSLSVLLLHDRIDMRHDVHYVDWIRHEDPDRPHWQMRTERYFDRTNTWGLHLEYVRPLASEGWRLGTILTGNRKGHPKIPNYDLMNIPRDPGTSWAYNVGAGVSHTSENTTVGADLVFEPIFSDTWAKAQERISLPNGGILFPGEKTVQNDFTFANTALRTGLRHGQDWWDFQFGLEVRTTRYWLTQKDRVEQTKRDQYEEWSEWRLTWGGGLEWGAVNLRYTGRVTLGTGRPGVTRTSFRAVENFAAIGDFIVAPRGALVLQESRVYTHQISLTVPILRGGE